MPAITLSETPQSAISVFNQTELVASTATAVINPTFSSIQKVSGPALPPQNFTIASLDAPGTNSKKSQRGFLTGRRPVFGLLFPRGYYNK